MVWKLEIPWRSFLFELYACLTFDLYGIRYIIHTWKNKDLQAAAWFMSQIASRKTRCKPTDSQNSIRKFHQNIRWILYNLSEHVGKGKVYLGENNLSSIIFLTLAFWKAAFGTGVCVDVTWRREFRLGRFIWVFIMF